MWTKVKLDRDLYVRGRGTIARCPVPTDGGVFECVDNKIRIASCWNACLPFENPESDIPKLVEALKEAQWVLKGGYVKTNKDEISKPCAIKTINDALSLYKEWE